VGGLRGRYAGKNITQVPVPVIVIFFTAAHINPRIAILIELAPPKGRSRNRYRLRHRHSGAHRSGAGELNPDLASDMSKAEDEMLCRPVWHNHCIDEKTFAPISEVDELPLLLGSSETGMT
jgi:hypothetical protein